MTKEMSVPNLHSPIIPGKSAAGYTLKSTLTSIFPDISTVEMWREELGQLGYVISNTDGWIRFLPKSLGKPGFRSGSHYFFGRGAVQLIFDKDDKLDSIGLGYGYKGLLFEKVSIGDRLSSVLEYFEIEYDPADEVHYPIGAPLSHQIEFYAEEYPLSEVPDQRINAIFVKQLQ